MVALTCDAAGTRLLTVLGPNHLDKLPAPPRTAITIQVWDVASKKVLFKIPAPEVGHRFHRLFSPDGSRLVTMLTNSRNWPNVGKPREGIIVRDGTTGEELYEISEPEIFVGFTGKDNQLVTASRRKDEGEVDRLTFRDTRDGNAKPTRVFPITPVAATALAIRADGRFAAVGQGTGSITLYDLTGGQLPRVLWGHGAAVVRVVFEEGGETLLSYCEKGEVRRHGLSDPEVRQLSGRIILGRPHFSPDGSRVLTEHREGGLSYGLWDSDTAAEVARVIVEEGGGHLVGDVSMSRDASRVAVCCVQDARFPHHRGHTTPQEMLRAGPLFPALLPMGPGDLVANAMSFARFTPAVERIRVWDVAGQRVLFERSRERGRFAPWVPRLSPDGRHLLLLSDPPPGWTVYDLDTGAATCTGDLLTGDTPPLGNGLLHFADNRMMIAEPGPGGIPTHAVFRWWDLKTGKPLATHRVELPMGGIGARFEAAPDGRRLAIHPTILALVAQVKTPVFDVTPAGVRQILEVPSGAMAFSRDGRKLATAVGLELDVWDLDEPGPPLKLRGLQPGPPYLMAFSPDGRRLVACEARQRLRVWDLTTGRELLALTCPFPAQSMQFVGDRLVVAGGDRLWVLDGTPRDRR